ncbi:MAG TPA: phosphoribosylformylglycinamidine cyclo-ligase [Solirubrobacterales bacterium]|jgi:phosphoribosylformylglycinamidine cyclo-ligase|nr:phosphoribosylformylglycinamidine cyclo-ligase [Solirubrobacterales bacterium]
MSEQDAYVRAGVNQPHADASVAALVAHLSQIDPGRPSRVVPLPGHYASVIRVDEWLGVAMTTDGVGTKMVVAERLGRFDAIGIDCIAMNVNDVVCVGAEPIAMLDFILCSEANPEVCDMIGAGLRKGAEAAGIEIPGGEIAQVGDIVSGWELSGSAIGFVALDSIVTGDAVEPGDPVIGLPSSGLHSNGYTLARMVVADVPLEDERLGRPLGDVLLEPTEIYVPAVLELLESPVEVRGLAHITGDGVNNLLRLGTGVGYEIDDPLPVPPVFGLIQELGEVSDQEMYEVFNMGCGFCCIVSAGDEAAALDVLRSHYPDAKRIGSATDRPGEVRRVRT